MMSMMKNTAPTSVAPIDAPIAIGPVEALTHTASQRRQLLVLCRLWPTWVSACSVGVAMVCACPLRWQACLRALRHPAWRA